ncbi:recombinase RecT [Rothia koreensis]|uniref:recombinase RecT n=1 Tax=Rothia koreensis TaxID=592378 RepID=UPI0037C5399A
MSQTNQLAEQSKGLIFANSRQYGAMLPADQQEQSQVNGWLSAAYAALLKDKNLANAAMSAPESLMNALNEAAQLGLRPGTTQYYLTPRKNKGRWEVLGVTGYQGEVELMYRSGAVASVVVEAVHQGDTFRWSPGAMNQPEHAPNWFGDRGPLVGAYAYAIMNDGSVSKVVIVDQERIQAAKDASAGSDSPYSPWRKHPRAMYLKTAAHDLAKWVPTSAVDKSVQQIKATVGEKNTNAQVDAVTKGNTRAAIAEREDPEPQEVLEDAYVEAIAADDVDPGTGEISVDQAASTSQKAEVRKRMKALSIASDEESANQAVRDQLNNPGHKGVDGLTRGEADEVLAELAVIAAG